MDAGRPDCALGMQGRVSYECADFLQGAWSRCVSASAVSAELLQQALQPAIDEDRISLRNRLICGAVMRAA